MNRHLGLLVGFASVLPLAVEVPAPADSGMARRGETRLRIAGGYGHYAFMARNCEGRVIDQVPVRTKDVGAAVDHRFAGQPVRIGIRAGGTRDEIGRGKDSLRFANVPQNRTLTNRYVNPFIEVDGEDAGFSVGYVFHTDEFPTAGENARNQVDHPANDLSAHLRVGRRDERYFQLSWMEGVPIYSDGGYLTLGVGGTLPARRFEGFIGIGAGGPMEGGGPMLRGSYALTPALRLQLMLHGNTSGAATVGLGAEYRIPR